MAEWARVDVNFLRHPQVSRLRPIEQLGYLCMILYAQEHETDGDVPDSCLRWCDVKPAQVKAMQAAGLVTRTDDGWHISGFLNHQRSRAEMDEDREKARQRAKSGREAKRRRDQFEVAA
jgi:hypothetical protein